VKLLALITRFGPNGIEVHIDQEEHRGGAGMGDGRHTCTRENPWQPDMGRAVHPDVVEVGDQEDGYPGGDIQAYKCPHCGLRFKVELPQ